jgi:DNA-binding MarR family transcriptional regulator
MSKKAETNEFEVWRVFLKSHVTVIRLIEAEMEAAGCLPLSSYDVLLTLSIAEGRKLRMHEIADGVVLSRSGLTRLVDRLEKDGLLRRERSDNDRRGAYAVLTEKGLDALRQSWKTYALEIRRHFLELLSEDEVAVLTTALTRVFNTAYLKLHSAEKED